MDADENFNDSFRAELPPLSDRIFARRNVHDFQREPSTLASFLSNLS